MADKKRTGRRFTERLDDFGAIAFTGASILSALSTGNPLIQLATAALAPGAHIGVRTMLRSITGTPQRPMNPLLRVYSVGAATAMTPLVNLPSLMTFAGPSMAVAAVGAAATLYAATEGTSRKALAGKPGRKSPANNAPGVEVQRDSGSEEIFDLSADRQRQGEPRQEFRIAEPGKTSRLAFAAPQGKPPAPDRALRASPQVGTVPALDDEGVRPRTIEDFKAALREGLESRLARRESERRHEKAASPRMLG